MRTAFLIGDMSVSGKNRLCQHDLRLVGEFRKDRYVCYAFLQASGRNKYSSQMIIPLGNRTCPLGLEDKGVQFFKNLTC